MIEFGVLICSFYFFYFSEFEIEDVITKPNIVNGPSLMVANTPNRDHGSRENPEEPVYQWANELRPSMRKLRQGMDSLCKTARLICRYIFYSDG